MIVPPKKYLNPDGSVNLGGYLLNNEYYAEPLIIENPSLTDKPEISKII